MSENEKAKIHTTLDAMYENPKSRNFLNHLIRSYIPVSNVVKVVDKPKGHFKCVITQDELFSIEDIVRAVNSEKFRAEFMESLKVMFDEKANKINPIQSIVGDKKLGLTGKDTTTYMSYQTFQEFYNWVITKSLKGDKHINWLLGSIRRSTFIERAENINDQDVQDKVNIIKRGNNVKPATFTLADSSDILSKLKASLEAKEK